MGTMQQVRRTPEQSMAEEHLVAELLKERTKVKFGYLIEYLTSQGCERTRAVSILLDMQLHGIIVSKGGDEYQLKLTPRPEPPRPAFDLRNELAPFAGCLFTTGGLQHLLWLVRQRFDQLVPADYDVQAMLDQAKREHMLYEDSSGRIRITISS